MFLNAQSHFDADIASKHILNVQNYMEYWLCINTFYASKNAT